MQLPFFKKEHKDCLGWVTGTEFEVEIKCRLKHIKQNPMSSHLIFKLAGKPLPEYSETKSNNKKQTERIK